MKKIIALILAIMLIISSNPTLSDSYEEPIEKLNPVIMEEIEYSNKINDEFDKLIAYYGEYPEYYGGSYIIDKSFTICVTCDPSIVQDEIYTLMGDSTINLKKVPYSYNYLLDVQNNLTQAVSAFQSEGRDVADSIIGLGIDEPANTLFVEILNNSLTTDALIDELKSYFPELKIVLADKDYSPCASVVSGVGSELLNANTGYLYTNGFCASRINSAGVYEYGFVTAGHDNNLYNTIKISNTNVGKVAWRQYGSNADAAFVNMNDYPSSGYSRSRILSSSYQITGYTTVGVYGTTYVLHGKNSGLVTGTVDNRSFNFVMESIQFTDHIRMKMTVVQGDSGGPLVKTTSGNNRNVVGICSGGAGNYANFSKVSNILTNMGGSVY